MIKIIDKIDIELIIEELSSCPEDAWHDTKDWHSPTDYSQTTLSQEGLLNNKSVTREQDRLHIIWQADRDGGNQYWWQDPAWRDSTPVVTQYGKLFPNTIDLLTKFFNNNNQVLERMFFSRLQPEQQIYPHSDAAWGTDFEQNIRYGLVITTNPECLITSVDQIDNPAPGTVFWLDNCQKHSAINLGSTDRIYLYMDLKPKI